MGNNNQYLNPWREEEIDFLRSKYLILSHKQIADILKRSPSSIKGKAHVLNLVLPSDILYKRRVEVVRKYHLGSKMSDYSKNLMSVIKTEQFSKGIFVPWNTNKKNPLLTKRNLENNPMKNRDYREKARQSNRKNGTYERASIRMRENNPAKNGLSETWKKNISIASKELWKNAEYQEIMYSKVLPMMRELAKTPASIKKRVVKAKLQWSNDESRDKLLNSLKTRPTKPEKIIMRIIQENRIILEYVGDGKKWVKHNGDVFNPDFINEDKKLIVEVYGDYWHNIPKNIERDKRRLEAYEKNGYKTLVIWEKETKNFENSLNKLNGFMR